MSERATGEVDRIVTGVTEWAIRCRTRDGDQFTGRAFITDREAIASGERLARINGVEWWLVTRRRKVTVETSEWERELLDRETP